MAKQPLTEGRVQQALLSIYNALVKGVNFSKKPVGDPELKDLLVKAEEAHKNLNKYMDEYYKKRPKEKQQLDFLKTKVFTR